MEQDAMDTIRVEYVVDISGPVVRTDLRGTLRCEDPRLLHTLATFKAQGKPVSIALGFGGSLITQVGSAPSDLIISMDDDDGLTPQLAVQLTKRPTLMYLQRSHPRFTPMQTLLRQAMAQRQAAAVATLPAGSDIEDVRIIQPVR